MNGQFKVVGQNYSKKMKQPKKNPKN